MYEDKVAAYLDAACAADSQNDLVAANRNFKFAAFYEGKRLGVDAREYAASCGVPYPQK